MVNCPSYPEAENPGARAAALEEGVSTRLLIYTGQLIAGGIAPRRACEIALVHAVSDDVTAQQAVADIVDVILP